MSFDASLSVFWSFASAKCLTARIALATLLLAISIYCISNMTFAPFIRCLATLAMLPMRWLHARSADGSSCEPAKQASLFLSSKSGVVTLLRAGMLRVAPQMERRQPSQTEGRRSLMSCESRAAWAGGLGTECPPKCILHARGPPDERQG
ncbi:hypothetical protein IE81DRAFT_163418 [Ceraceosorus guamensis]|uniref:Uncharacterized protein n=1 Tax=Ceraceosorus guamensis TaxID=1522189 RepID=A0A316WCM1_9BASI|nr:hypothetical protein IE81DRAFT_163418 [Ceraceosorus guamensis]PWN45613.1 hypothetical protein IE81DRAFT_163418 [Ceraceosorus guamensis]